MPLTLDNASLGSPVEVSAIGKELKKLWQADKTRTRATLFNFAVLCEGEDAMVENTELLSGFVRDHAFHALLIGVKPTDQASSVRAWINAHCYLPKAGAKHVCCEQVSLFIEGNARALLPNLLLSHLDYDIPLTLWWRGERLDLIDTEVWRWVDRLIFDSQGWHDARKQFSALRHSLGGQKLILCDLAWTRSLHLRQSLAQLFDTPDEAAALRHLRAVKITHAPGARTSAMLLLGWLAAQLGWQAHGSGGNHMRFSGANGDVICDLAETPGPAISRMELSGDALTIIAQRPPGTNYLHVNVTGGGRTFEGVMPADPDKLAALLDEELVSGGRHRVYLKALAAAEPLL